MSNNRRAPLYNNGRSPTRQTVIPKMLSHMPDAIRQRDEEIEALSEEIENLREQLIDYEEDQNNQGQDSPLDHKSPRSSLTQPVIFKNKPGFIEKLQSLKDKQIRSKVLEYARDEFTLTQAVVYSDLL